MHKCYLRKVTWFVLSCMCESHRFVLYDTGAMRLLHLFHDVCSGNVNKTQHLSFLMTNITVSAKSMYSFIENTASYSLSLGQISQRYNHWSPLHQPCGYEGTSHVVLHTVLIVFLRTQNQMIDGNPFHKHSGLLPHVQHHLWHSRSGLFPSGQSYRTVRVEGFKFLSHVSTTFALYTVHYGFHLHSCSLYISCLKYCTLSLLIYMQPCLFGKCFPLRTCW